MTTTLLFAEYMPCWDSPSSPLTPWYPPDKWGRFTSNFPERLPVLGANDESMQFIMNYHVQVASAGGIDGWCMNWYRDDFLTYGTKNFIASPYKSQMKWFIQWSNNSYNPANFTAVQYNTQAYFYEGIRRAAAYMSDSSYYRINGLPVLSILNTAQIDAIVGAQATLALQKTARATLLANCQQIIANVLAGDPTGGISGTGNACTVSGTYKHSAYLIVCTSDVGGWATLEPVNGMYLYNVCSGTFGGVARASHSFIEQMQAIDQVANSAIAAVTPSYAPGRTFWPTLQAGRNVLPWLDEGGADPDADYPAPTIGQFRAHCYQVQGYLTQYQQCGNTIIINAWNEHGEGAAIEPTQGLGNMFLSTVAKVFKGLTV